MAYTTFYENIRSSIDKFGLNVIGVLPEDRQPPFSYTIGLFEKYGFELINIGLPVEYAQVIFNSIALTFLAKGEHLELNVKDSRWANLAVKFVVCDKELTQDFGKQACEFYARKDIQFIQIVVPDKNGLFPDEQGFDHDYMDPRQQLLFR